MNPSTTPMLLPSTGGLPQTLRMQLCNCLDAVPKLDFFFLTFYMGDDSMGQVGSAAKFLHEKKVK
jgi:hypothetical protein